MPTGYTAAIADGITFQQFAMTCARAFGATITMRDESLDAPIPDEFPESTYHCDAIAHEEARLAQFEAMTDEEAGNAARAAFEAEKMAQEARRAEKTELRNKYNSMLTEVVQWQPPMPDHEALKAFMINQIRGSIKFDCMEFGDEPSELDGPTWRTQKIEAVRWWLEYHKKEAQEEAERTRKRNEWVKALRDSLQPAGSVAINQGNV